MNQDVAMGPAAAMCGIAYPVFQAGMAGISGPALTAAVSNAGGLGHLGGLRLPPLALRKWIRETKALTDKPFGVNIVPAFGGPEVFEAQFRVILEERPRVLSLFYGDFAEMIPRAKAAGITVIVQVGTVKLARQAIDWGADILVAQGTEGGGHLNPGTIGVLPLVRAFVEIAEGRPVLAAGGITDRADVRAVLEAGAAGVWVGTAFVATNESLAHDRYKQKIIEATIDNTERRTGYSFGWPFGTPHRVIPSAKKWSLIRYVGGGVRVIDKPELAEKLSLYAGQGVSKIHDVVPAAERVRELAAGFACWPVQSASCEAPLLHAVA